MENEQCFIYSGIEGTITGGNWNLESKEGSMFGIDLGCKMRMIFVLTGVGRLVRGYRSKHSRSVEDNPQGAR